MTRLRTKSDAEGVEVIPEGHGKAMALRIRSPEVDTRIRRHKPHRAADRVVKRLLGDDLQH